MPQGFRFVDADADLIVPLAFDRAQAHPGRASAFRASRRLKPGVTIAQANADLARLVPVWMDSWPNAPGINPHVYETWRITPALRPLKQDVVGNVGNVLWVVMGTIGMVMLIACANVANLLLVRAEARQQELAVRAALGAGWGESSANCCWKACCWGSWAARWDSASPTPGCVSWWPSARPICRA